MVPYVASECPSLEEQSSAVFHTVRRNTWKCCCISPIGTLEARCAEGLRAWDNHQTCSVFIRCTLHRDYRMSFLSKGREWLLITLTRIHKFVMRLLTRQGELERVVMMREGDSELGGLSANLVKGVSQSLARSSELTEIKKLIFGRRPFSINDALDKIVRIKRIRDNDVISALRWCLQVSYVKSLTSTVKRCCTRSL